MSEIEELRRRREATLWRMLVRAHLVHGADVTARIRAAGFPELQPGWPRVLGHLDTDGTRLKTIAARAQMTRQAAGQMVDDIERAGCVVRKPDPTDARGVVVCFTPKGRAMLDTAVAAMAEVEAAYASAIGEEAYGELKRGLAALLARIDDDGSLTG